MGTGISTKIYNLMKNNSVADMMNDGQECSFYRFLAVFIGCINPRSFEELFKDVQRAQIEMVIQRLVCRTAIEIEGWKRIPAARRLFDAAKLQIDEFTLKYEAIDHPYLKKVREFQDN